MELHIGYGGKYVAIYNKPLSEAKESNRVCRFPRTPETEQLARVMVAGPELLKALNVTVSHLDELESNGDIGRKKAECLKVARAAIAKATGENA